MRITIQRNQTGLIFVVLFLTIGIGFFLPISIGNGWGILVKIVLLIFIFLLLYVLFFQNEWIRIPFKGRERADDQTASAVAAAELTQEGTWKGFGDAFYRYVQEFLSVVRQTFVASCAGLYLQKGQEGLEFEAGEDNHGQWSRRILVSEGTLVEHVAKQKIPILEDNLPIGTSLDGIPGTEIRSFLGIPLIWENEIVGVLALGGETTESFSVEDQDFLVIWSDLLKQVMALCHRGLRWEMDQEVYRVHLDLERMLSDVDDAESALSCFAQLIRQLFHFDRLTLCIKDGEEGVIQHVYGQIDNLDRGLRFSLNEGLNGWILKRNAPMIISDMEKGDYIRPRYFRGEDSKHALRSFLGVPLGRGEEVWGCLSIESRSVGQYTEKGKEVLETLAGHLYETLHRISLASRPPKPG